MANEASIIEKTLSQEFRDFLYSRMIVIKNPAAYLDNFLNIMTIDCYNEPNVKKATTLFQVLLFLLIFVGFFTLFAFVMTISTLESGDNILTTVIFDTVLLLYYYFLINAGIRKKELKNRYMGFRLSNGVIPVLHVLKEEFDTHPDSEMSIDLSPIEDKLNKINQEKYNNGREQTFIKTWFTYTSPLQTGGNIRITIADKFRLRKYTKTSSCGNIKSKRKEKTTHFVKVELYLPESKSVVQKPDQKYPDCKVKLLSETNKSAVAVAGKFVNPDPEKDVVLPSAVLTTMANAFKCYKQA
jgi:hypothetical protein